MNKNIGTTHNAIIEKHLDKNTGMLKCMTENYITVILNSDDKNLINTMQTVKITEIKDGKVFGVI